jgi:predicted DNA-binding protein
MANVTKPVRLSERAHEILSVLSKQANKPITVVLEQAIEEYRRKKFFEEAEAAYLAMQTDPEAMAEYENEMALWDNTLMDGLDED